MPTPNNKPRTTNNKLLPYLPAQCTIRGDWESRQLYIDDEYVDGKITSGAFPSLTHLLPAQKWALMVLMHFAPVHIVAEAIEQIAILNVIAKEFESNDFEKKVKLLRIVETAKTATTYAY